MNEGMVWAEIIECEDTLWVSDRRIDADNTTAPCESVYEAESDRGVNNFEESQRGIAGDDLSVEEFVEWMVPMIRKTNRRFVGRVHDAVLSNLGQLLGLDIKSVECFSGDNATAQILTQDGDVIRFRCVEELASVRRAEQRFRIAVHKGLDAAVKKHWDVFVDAVLLTATWFDLGGISMDEDGVAELLREYILNNKSEELEDVVNGCAFDDGSGTILFNLNNFLIWLRKEHGLKKEVKQMAVTLQNIGCENQVKARRIGNKVLRFWSVDQQFLESGQVPEEG